MRISDMNFLHYKNRKVFWALCSVFKMSRCVQLLVVISIFCVLVQSSSKEEEEEHGHVKELDQHLQQCCNLPETERTAKHEEQDRVISRECSQYTYGRVRNVTSELSRNKATVNDQGNVIDDSSTTVKALKSIFNIESDMLLQKIPPVCGQRSKGENCDNLREMLKSSFQQ